MELCMNKLYNDWQEKRLKYICIINYCKGLGKSDIVMGIFLFIVQVELLLVE